MMPKDNEPEPLSGEEEDLRELKRLETSMSGIRSLLNEALCKESAEYWAPHVRQLLHAIDRFRKHCRDEIERFGEWREDGRETDEVIDMLEDECERLCEWIPRMILPRAHQSKTQS
jgi:hypothetical protein